MVPQPMGNTKMKIDAVCCCGATLHLDSSGADDSWVLDRIERQFTTWNEMHSGKCEPPRDDSVDARVVGNPRPAMNPGYMIVPIEPTEAMLLAGGHVNSEWLNDSAPLNEGRYVLPMEGVWKAMVHAGPNVGTTDAAPVVGCPSYENIRAIRGAETVNNGNEPAFACAGEGGHQMGLTKREYFAAMAMQGYCARGQSAYMQGPKDIAIEARSTADMLLALLD